MYIYNTSGARDHVYILYIYRERESTPVRC